METTTPCAFCKVKEADERSEHGWCMKCHFDLTEEILEIITEQDFLDWEAKRGRPPQENEP